MVADIYFLLFFFSFRNLLNKSLCSRDQSKLNAGAYGYGNLTALENNNATGHLTNNFFTSLVATERESSSFIGRLGMDFIPRLISTNILAVKFFCGVQLHTRGRQFQAENLFTNFVVYRHTQRCCGMYSIGVIR